MLFDMVLEEFSQVRNTRSKTVYEGLQIEKETGTDFWRRLIENYNVQKMIELDRTQPLKVFGTKVGK